MTDTFRMIALPSDRFAPLFERSAEALQALNIRRVVVDEKPGTPCRVSLVDAEVGETTLLLYFTHHDVATPFRATGPVYVRQGAVTASPEPGEIPVMFNHRHLSVRGYDAEAMLADAAVVKGPELAEVIRRLFENEEVNYLHVHNAGQGCYLCRVERA